MNSRDHVLRLCDGRLEFLKRLPTIYTSNLCSKMGAQAKESEFTSFGSWIGYVCVVSTPTNAKHRDEIPADIHPCKIAGRQPFGFNSQQRKFASLCLLICRCCSCCCCCSSDAVLIGRIAGEWLFMLRNYRLGFVATTLTCFGAVMSYVGSYS